MRKTQVALAAVALLASGAAMANGVTMYGIIDASVVSANGTTSFAGTGNWLPSLWGVNGTEDLGGGMKASFNLEQGIGAGTGAIANGGMGGSTDGTQSTSMFNRGANVGLSGDFGGLKLGLQVSPFIAGSLGGYVNDNMSFYVNSLALTTTAVTSSGAGGANASGGFFVPNAVSYSLPGNLGFTGSVLTTLDGGVEANKYTAGTVGTQFGALAVNAAFQQRGGVAGTGYKSYNVNASTNLGSAKVAAGYTNHDLEGTTSGTQTAVSAVNVGISYPIQEGLVVALNHVSSSQAGASSKSLTNASIQYSLSKRTFLYGTIGHGKNGAGVVYEGGPTYTSGSKTGTAIGLAHSF